jgi:glycosyltransferase involved in cell wall biosynthesis
MRRALVIDPGLNSPGGGTCVAAHALAALRRDFAVTLLSWHPVDFAPVNAAFGTDLAEGDFRFERVPGWWRRAFSLAPTPLALLMGSLLQRHARALLRREHFDLVVSTTNEVDVGVRAVQYIHYPFGYYPRPDGDYRWYHAAPLVRLYRTVAAGISGASDSGIARNRTLANSEWTARRFRDWYRGDAQVVYPPVAVDRAPLPWSDRTDAFACIGRMSGEKDVLGVIDILAEVRRRGHSVSLMIFGQRQNRAYERRVIAAAAAHRDWISIALDLPRAEFLERVARCRFGIHGMAGEHFGIAVAEMVRLGCVCLAPSDGGPAEILGGDASLLYGLPADAVAKICRLLDDPDTLAAARTGLEKRAPLFSVERFSDELRRVCQEFATAPD